MFYRHRRYIQTLCVSFKSLQNSILLTRQQARERGEIKDRTPRLYKYTLFTISNIYWNNVVKTLFTRASRGLVFTAVTIATPLRFQRCISFRTNSLQIFPAHEKYFPQYAKQLKSKRRTIRVFGKTTRCIVKSQIFDMPALLLRVVKKKKKTNKENTQFQFLLCVLPD